MQTEYAHVIELLKKLIPEEADIAIQSYEQPTCSTAVYADPTPKIYYQIYLSLPLKKGSKIAYPNNVFSITRRVETLERTPEAWLLTITSMVNQEVVQRGFVQRRTQQARRQEWLLGADVRIDGKESTRKQVSPRLRGFII